MGTIIRGQVGGVVPIRFTFRKVRNDSANGERQRINGGALTITRPDGGVLTNPPTLVYERRGCFIAYLNTAGFPTGDYEVTGTFGVGFDTQTGVSVNTIQRRVTLRLVENL